MRRIDERGATRPLRQGGSRLPEDDDIVQAEIEVLRSLRQLLDAPSEKPVTLVGDVILDRYFHGWANHLMSIAPVPVVKVIRRSESAGAAAHIARGLLSLGLKTRFFSILGGDRVGHLLAQLLQEEGVDTSDIRVAAHMQTAVKTRIFGSRESLIEREQLLMQFDEEPQEPVPPETVQRMAEAVKKAIPGSAALVLSDYGKGMVGDENAPEFIGLAKEHGVPVICDPKLTGLHRTHGATITLFEKRGLELLRRRGNFDTVEETAAHFIDEHSWDAMLVLGGQTGVTLHRADGTTLNLPCMLDVQMQQIGLHDAAATGLAAALGSGRSLEDSARLANAACECVLAAGPSEEVLDRRRLSTRLDELAWQLQISDR